MGRDRANQSETKPLRLFVAAEVPSTVKGAVAAVVAPFRDRIKGARWTPEDGWHLTLKFLGTTWPRMLDNVREGVGAVAGTTAPFTTEMTHVGVFPSPGRTRVLWVGLTDPAEAFAALAGRLDDALVEHFPPERRAFTAHLTLARLNPSRDIREFAAALLDLPVRAAPWEVTELVLFRSHLSPRGATYEPLERFPFGGGA